MAPDLPSLADFAQALAVAARRETLPGSGGAVAIENKLSSGFDPVTLSDKKAEQAIRSLIERRYPDHGIVGEEFADRRPRGPFTWSIDPIDGTRAYVCGLPTWTTLIGLLQHDEPVLGLIDAPRLDETYIGYGSTALKRVCGKEQTIATSRCAAIGEARLSTTDPDLFNDGEAEFFGRLRGEVRLTRYGLDGYGYAAVAAGGVDIVVESGLKPHDYNAVVPIVRAAGGAVANWSGGSDLSSGRIVAAASEKLLEATCRLLR